MGGLTGLASRVVAALGGGRHASLVLHALHNLAHLRIENVFFSHSSRSVAGCAASLLFLQVPYLELQEGSSWHVLHVWPAQPGKQLRALDTRKARC